MSSPRICSPPSSIARSGWCTSAATCTTAVELTCPTWDWAGQRATGSYADSKLFVATLAVGVARIWPGVYSNAVDPGWVPTRMGGPGAPDELRLGHLTQAWLATSDEPEAGSSRGYWFHQRLGTPHPAVHEPRFQDDLFDALARFTGVPLA
jgi:NAD(P)-dependent dehydrogenase (short-subunit alcohol dehydrogenase family)